MWTSLGCSTWQPHRAMGTPQCGLHKRSLLDMPPLSETSTSSERWISTIQTTSDIRRTSSPKRWTTELRSLTPSSTGNSLLGARNSSGIRLDCAYTECTTNWDLTSISRPFKMTWSRTDLSRFQLNSSPKWVSTSWRKSVETPRRAMQPRTSPRDWVQVLSTTWIGGEGKCLWLRTTSLNARFPRRCPSRAESWWVTLWIPTCCSHSSSRWMGSTVWSRCQWSSPLRHWRMWVLGSRIWTQPTGHSSKWAWSPTTGRTWWSWRSKPCSRPWKHTWQAYSI